MVYRRPSFCSLERVLDYLRIDHEPGENEGTNPPAYWPASGNLRVERLSAKYSDGSLLNILVKLVILN